MTLGWRKSSRSGSSGSQSDCVEVARLPRTIGVRDSKDPFGPTLSVPSSGFRDLMTAIKRGDHDAP
jgi:Domain of unknown function (DUF397)